MRVRQALAVLAASVILASGDADAQHPPRTFASVVGPGVLRWEMSCEAARAALERTGVHPATEQMTGMFDGPGRPGGWAEITFQKLTWSASGGREAHAECESYRLASVRYVRRGLGSAVLARALVGPFTLRYGRRTEEHDTEYGAHVWVWLNATTRLSVIVVADPSAPGRWNVIEEWAPVSSERSW